jgi:hypothetical protein
MVYFAPMSVTRPLQRRTEEAFSNSTLQVCEDPVVAWLGRETSEHPNEIGDKTYANINTRRVQLFVPWLDI